MMYRYAIQFSSRVADHSSVLVSGHSVIASERVSRSPSPSSSACVPALPCPWWSLGGQAHPCDPDSPCYFRIIRPVLPISSSRARRRRPSRRPFSASYEHTTPRAFILYTVRTYYGVTMAQHTPGALIWQGWDKTANTRVCLAVCAVHSTGELVPFPRSLQLAECGPASRYILHLSVTR